MATLKQQQPLPPCRATLGFLGRLEIQDQRGTRSLYFHLLQLSNGQTLPNEKESVTMTLRVMSYEIPVLVGRAQWDLSDPLGVKVLGDPWEKTEKEARRGRKASVDSG